MSHSSGERIAYEHEVVLTWPVNVPNAVQALFGKVCRNASKTINYVSKGIFKKGPFHLMMLPADFELLHKDPVNWFPQVKNITVVCRNDHQVLVMKQRFPHDVHKTEFATLNELLRMSNQINQHAKTEIRRAYEEYCQSENSAISQNLCRTLPLGFPMNRSTNIIPESLCSSCKLVIQQAFHLRCDHFICKLCRYTKTK